MDALHRYPTIPRLRRRAVWSIVDALPRQRSKPYNARNAVIPRYSLRPGRPVSPKWDDSTAGCQHNVDKQGAVSTNQTARKHNAARRSFIGVQETTASTETTCSVSPRQPMIVTIVVCEDSRLMQALKRLLLLLSTIFGVVMSGEKPTGLFVALSLTWAP